MSAYDTATQEGTDAELTDFDGRPADCDCWDADAELPCWPCYRDGFEQPNPSTAKDSDGYREGRTERSGRRRCGGIPQTL